MSWLGLILLSVVMLATAEIVQQRLLTKHQSVSPTASASLTFGVEWLYSIPVVFLFHSPQEIFVWHGTTIAFQILAITALASLGMRFYLQSFKVQNMSFSSIFGAISIPVSTLLGIVAFSEGAEPTKLLGIGLILFAIASVHFKNQHIEKNSFYSLISGTMFGVAYTFDKSIVQTIPPLIYIWYSFLLIPLYGFLPYPRKHFRELRSVQWPQLRVICVSATAYFLYNFLTFSAYRAGGDVGSVDAVNTSVVFIILGYEFVFMRNRHSIVRKVSTSVLACGGVYLLSLT